MRRGWLHLATGAGAGRILGFVSNLLISRLLGPTDLGLFNLVSTTVQTSDTLVRCGGDYALNYELGGQPEAIKTERGAQLALAFSQICTLMTTLICICISIWIWFGDGLFPISLSADRLSVTALLLLMIACEGTAASAWEVLLVSHRTAPLALRQGLFFPLRFLSSALGSLLGGVPGAMAGWSLIGIGQSIWLKTTLKSLWKPFKISFSLIGSMRQLLSRGLPFYAVNLVASLIFYPLLLRVAGEGSLDQLGFLRVGQILQQLFAFIPSTLVPVLFLELRSQPTFTAQSLVIERFLPSIWVVLLEILLLYCSLDSFLIPWLFGSSFSSALLPTRLLLLTSLLECLAQLVFQPILASAHTRMYAFWQNAAAVLAAVLGWLWIPTGGLDAYLIVRMFYVSIPLAACGVSVVKRFYRPQCIAQLVFITVGVLALNLLQPDGKYVGESASYIFLALFFSVFVLRRQDLSLVYQVIMKRV